MSSITSAFIDLAAQSDIDNYYYSPSSPMEAQIPIFLSCTDTCSGEHNYDIERSGDLLSYVWAEISISEFALDSSNRFGQNGRLFWTKNLGHNLFQDISIVYREQVVQSLTDIILDVHSHFFIPAKKKDAYDWNIGNREELTDPQQNFQETTLTVPLPFFFCRDRDSALPVCAINGEGMIRCISRIWDELLILTNIQTGEKVIPLSDELSAIPKIDVKIGANYIVCSNTERARMAADPYQCKIETYQQSSPYVCGVDRCINTDLLFSNSVRTFVYFVKNNENVNERSIYLNNNGKEQIEQFGLVYDSTVRLSRCKSNYTSFITSYYHMDRCPEKNGMHMYTYSTKDIIDKNASGSTCQYRIPKVTAVVDLDPSTPVGSTFYVVAHTRNIISINYGHIGMLYN